VLPRRPSDLGICDSCQQRAAWESSVPTAQDLRGDVVTRSVIEGFLTGTRRAVNAVIHPNDHAATEPPISSLTRSGRPAAILGRWKKQWRHGAVGRYESPDPERPCHPAASECARIFCGEIGQVRHAQATGGTNGIGDCRHRRNDRYLSHAAGSERMCRGLGTSTSTASIIGTSEATRQR